MCRDCQTVRKLADDTAELQVDDKTKKEAAKKESDLKKYLLAALLFLRPNIKQYQLVASLPWKEFEEQLSTALGPGFAIHDLSAFAALSGVGNYDNLDPRTINRLQLYRSQFIREFGGETKDALEMAFNWANRKGMEQDAVTRLLQSTAGLNKRQMASVLTQFASREDAGMSEKRLWAALEKQAAKYLKQRASTTAGTEGWRLFQLGKFSGFEQISRLQGTVFKRWETAEDERVCPVCWGLQGEVNSIGIPFATKYGPVMFPPAHPSCRCEVVYFVGNKR